MAIGDERLSASGNGRRIVSMNPTQPPVRTTTLLAWAIVFGLVVDVLTNGPPGLGFLLVATTAALGVALVARPKLQAIAFLVAGLTLVSFTVVRASPVLAGLDLVTGSACSLSRALSPARATFCGRACARTWLARSHG
jgi:hypothetical protein